MIVQFTKCKHCGQNFHNPQLELLIIASDKAAEMSKFMNTLARHLIQVHPDLVRQLEMESVGFQGALRMLQFEQTEPSMKQAITSLGETMIRLFAQPQPQNDPKEGNENAGSITDYNGQTV